MKISSVAPDTVVRSPSAAITTSDSPARVVGVAPVEAARCEVAPVRAPAERRVEAPLGLSERRGAAPANRERDGRRGAYDASLLAERDPVASGRPHRRELLALDGQTDAGRRKLDAVGDRNDVEAVHDALSLDLGCEVGERAAVRREPPVAGDVVGGVSDQLGRRAVVDAVEVRAAGRELGVEQRAVRREGDGEQPELRRHREQRGARTAAEVDPHQRLRALGRAAAIGEVPPATIEDGGGEEVGIAREACQVAAGDVEQPELGRRIAARRCIRRQHGEGDERAGHLRRGVDRPAARMAYRRDAVPLLEAARRRDVDPVRGRTELGEDEPRLGRGRRRLVVAVAVEGE